MTLIFIIKDLDSDSIYIWIFRFNTENIEIQEENDFEEENCSPMDMDNYYSDQEYWFEGDD